MGVLWTDKTLTQAAGMFDAAMPSQADSELNARVAASVRAEEVQRVMAEAERVHEACRLTAEWMNGFYLGRGTEPGPLEIALVAIGYYKELGDVVQPIQNTPGKVVGKCKLCGGLLSELDGVTSCDNCSYVVTR